MPEPWQFQPGNSGRPPLDIDETLVRRLARIHCTNEEIASCCGCSVDTLMRRFAEAIKEAKEQGKASLRRHQWKGVVRGNTTMQIWMGKQILGQTDKVEHLEKRGTDFQIRRDDRPVKGEHD